MPNVEISVVVPVYRSANTLPTLIKRLVDTLSSLGVSYQIICIDDGSPDHSWPVLVDLQRKYSNCLIIVQLMRNYGQHNALMCGFRKAEGRFIITLDDDLQNPPEEIPVLYRAIRDQNIDLVYGQPHGKKHAPWRNAGSFVINCFFKRVFRLPVSVTSYRIMRRELMECTFSYGLNFTFIDGLLAWNSTRIGSVEVNHHPRQEGRSGYSITKLVTLALNLFTNFSLLPLQFISLCGFIFAGFGFLLAIYYIVMYFMSAITVPGYASIMVATLLMGGVQLLSLGVMGEYLGRLHLNVNRKPQYVERQTISSIHDTFKKSA